MINPNDLRSAVVLPDQLTDRQQTVSDLVEAYVAIAHEMPSAGWLSRRLDISRQRAQQHLEAIRAKRRPIRG